MPTTLLNLLEQVERSLQVCLTHATCDMIHARRTWPHSLAEQGELKYQAEANLTAMYLVQVRKRIQELKT